jgi:Na+/glutamate symporter
MKADHRNISPNRKLLLIPTFVLLLAGDAWLSSVLTQLPKDNLFLKIFTELGNGAVDFVLSLVLLTINKQFGKAALGSFATGGIIVNVLKYVVGRARPYATAYPWVIIGPTVDGSYG